MLELLAPHAQYAFGATIADRTRDILIEERHDLGIASLMMHKSVTPSRLGAELGFAPPTTPAWTGGTTLFLVGTGPGVWLTMTEAASPAWAQALATRVAGLASVADQSSAYTVLRLSGTGARKLLGRGAFIDLDPKLFTPGMAATTVIAHIGVTLWQRDETPSYELAVFRSYTESFRHWIEITLPTLPITNNHP